MPDKNALAAKLIELVNQRCQPCHGGTPPLTQQQIEAQLPALPDWRIDNNRLTKSYKFVNHYETMAFVNAIAWISHRQDHHPDLEVGYNQCKVNYSTHAIGGLSDNDFICAAKVENLTKN